MSELQQILDRCPPSLGAMLEWRADQTPRAEAFRAVRAGDPDAVQMPERPVRIGAGSWEVEYELERELSRGEHLDVGVRLHVPDRHALSPLLVAAPIRRATEMRVSIDFGDPPVVRRVWVLDGVFPAVAMSGQEPSAAIVLPTTDPVDQVFLAPRPGLCYGFGWEWA